MATMFQAQAGSDSIARRGPFRCPGRAGCGVSPHAGQGTCRTLPDDGRGRPNAGSRRGQSSRRDRDRSCGAHTSRAGIGPGNHRVCPATFSIQACRLPRGATEKTINITPDSSNAPRLSLLTVLLVEPSRTQSGIIRKYLQVQGIQNIAAAASGQEALQSVRAERPDTIISALHLPDMTGVQLAQQVHAEMTATAPGFVLISSEAEGSDAGSLSRCGKAVLVKKPFTPEQLLDALRVVWKPLQPVSPTERRSTIRVLIVDDSTPARMHIRRSVLTEMGLADIVEAPDGAQAVAAVAGESFDLIVTDYNMPFMDGRGLVGYLSRTRPRRACRSSW